MLLLFIDGVGVREPASDNPVTATVCPTLHRLMAEKSVPIDACLGVPGLPQSATGQTTLFTGVNAPKCMGRHVEGFPGPSLRTLITDDNLLLALTRKTRRVRFANGYLAESVEEIRARRFKSVTTVAALTCPETFCLREDLLANQAVFHDITRATMRQRGYTGPLVTPQEAAEHLLQIALAHDFTVTVSTDTPAKDENVTTTFDFTLDAPVTGGTASYSATLNGFGPYTSSAPLCDEVAKSGDPCPLAAGHHHQESVSAASTTGKLVLKITWTSETGAEILCAQVTTKTV